MDFSVIRPRLPPKRPEPPTPKPSAASEDKPSPPPHEKPLPPNPPALMAIPHMGPYMEEIDRVSRMQHLRNIEYTNARTWRMNFGHHHNDFYDNSDSNYGCHQNYHSGGGYNGGYTHHMFPVRPQPLAEQYNHYSLPGPPQRLALPPPDHNYGPPGPSYYPAPHHGGYFSDEHPNGCMIM